MARNTQTRSCCQQDVWKPIPGNYGILWPQSLQVWLLVLFTPPAVALQGSYPGSTPCFGQGPGPWSEEHDVGVWIMHLAFTESSVWGVPGLSHICIVKANMKWPTWYIFRNVQNEKPSWNCSSSWIWCILVFIPPVKHCKRSIIIYSRAVVIPHKVFR